MSGILTRILNNQISNALSGNTQLGINGNLKLQEYTVTGSRLANNLNYGSDFTATGTITGGNIATSGTVSATGNVIGNYFLGNIACATGYNSNTIYNGDSNVLIATANGNITMSVNGTPNVVVVTDTTLQTNNISTSGNAIVGGDLVVNGNLTYVNVTDLNIEDPIIGLGRGPNNAPLTVDDGKDRGEQLWYYAGSEKSAFTGYDNSAGKILLATDVTITNEIVSVNNYGNLVIGNLEGTSSSVTGTATAGNVLTGGIVSATGTGTFGNVATGGVVSATGTGTFGNISTAGTVTATGTITGGNVLTGGVVSATGTVTGGNISTAGDVTATGTVTGGNINTAGAVSAGGNVTGGNILFGSGVVTGTGNIYGGNITASGAFFGNVNLTGDITVNSLTSNTYVSAGGTITGGNLATAGTVSATGTGTFGNIATGGVISATGNITGGNINAGFGDINGGNIQGFALILSGTGNITTPGNISAAGTATLGNVLTGGVVSATGTGTFGNIATGGVISATGNITGNYFFGNGSQLTGIDTNLIKNGDSNVRILTANGNISMDVNGTSNVVVVTQNGIDLTGVLSASGNVTGQNLFTAGDVSATGDVTANNTRTSNVISTGQLSITSGSNGNILIQPNGSGNIILANTYVNGVAYPAQDQDAASKIYVDNMVSTGLAYHPAVLVATTANLATTTGGTITYTQPNGASNGVAAQISTTGSFNLIDTANVQTVGTRILVKDEGNAVLNGVYTWANATTIVRATDADEYGPNSSEQLSINDYFFVQSGNVNLGSAFVVDAPVGVITFGTSNIQFAQFSSSQVYSANTNAGLSLIGQQFNAKVDNNTTAFDGGGNIIVKASANLTTPNIGAATGTSLSLTGNVISGNVYTGGEISAVGTAHAGNLHTGGIVTATGNIIGANMFTGGEISATGNLNGGNIATGGTISATSTITGGNLATAGSVTATGSITGGNVYTGGEVSATGTVTGGNIATAGTVSATGTITGGNIATAGAISATGNITGDYFFGNGSQLTGIDTNLIKNGDSNVRILTANGNISMDVAGTSNVVVVTTAGMSVTGNVQSTQYTLGANAVFGSSLTATTGATVAINSTDSILVPVGNTVQRPSGVTGMLRFNTTTDKLEIYDSNSWEPVGATQFTVIGDEQFAGDGSTVTFVLSDTQTTNSCIVSINGVVQIPGTAYSVTGTNLTFTEPPQPGDAIDVRKITTTTTVVAIQNSPANAAVTVTDTSNVVTVTGRLAGVGNALTVQGDLSVTGNVNITGNIATNQINNGTSAVQIPVASGNVNIDVGAVDNMTVFTSTGAFITGNLSVTGDVIANNVNSLSDATLKTNVQDITNALGTVNNMRGVGYDWLDGSGHAYGVIAQEVEAIVPEAVKTGEDGKKSVNYNMLIAFLIESVKTLSTEIAELRAQIKK